MAWLIIYVIGFVITYFLVWLANEEEDDSEFFIALIWPLVWTFYIIVFGIGLYYSRPGKV